MKTKKLFPVIFVTSLIVICFTFFQSNAESNSDPDAIVTRVFVYNGNSTVDSARVSLQQDGEEVYSAFTGVSGKAVFINVRPGVYNIIAVKSGLGSGKLINQFVGSSSILKIYISNME